MGKEIYKTITKNGRRFIVFDTMQAIADIYEYNKKLGGKNGVIEQ